MSDTPVIRNHGEIIASIPHLLGFQPRQSLVLLLLDEQEVRMRTPEPGEPLEAATRTRYGVHCTVRVDLPRRPEELSELMEALSSWSREARRSGTALGVLYTDAVTAGDAAAFLDGRSDLPEMPVAGEPHPEPVVVAAVTYALQDWAREARTELRDVLLVAQETWRSALCEGECCPREGFPLSSLGESPMAALRVLRGERVLASREELAALLSPATATERRAVGEAVVRLGTRTPVRRELLDAWEDAVRLRAEGSDAWQSDETLARLLWLVADIGSRDRVLARVAVPPLPPDEELLAGLDVLAGLVRFAPDEPLRAAAAGTLAFAAYQQGNGALASCALEVAFFADPGHSLSRIVHTALLQGRNPNEMRLSVAAAREVERSFPLEAAAVAPLLARGWCGPVDLPRALPTAVSATFRAPRPRAASGGTAAESA